MQISLRVKHSRGLSFRERGLTLLWSFSSSSSAQQESIERRALNLQNRVQREAQTLDEENVVFTNRMQDLLLRAVQEVNADKKYKMVVSASALLDADMALDITDAVLAKFNELYAAEKAEK